MTAINEWDRADRYSDGRIPHDDFVPADVPDPFPARPLTPTEQRARQLRIDDPWDEQLIRGRCPECGATARHAGTCTLVGGPGYTGPKAGAA